MSNNPIRQLSIDQLEVEVKMLAINIDDIENGNTHNALKRLKELKAAKEYKIRLLKKPD